MKIKRQAWWKIGKWIMVLLAVIIILFVILTIMAWRVLKSDHQYVIERLEQIILKDYNAVLKIEGYNLELLEPFPLIGVSIKNLEVSNENLPAEKVISFNHLTTQFDAWDILTGNFRSHPLALDSAKVFIHTDSTGFSNTNFKKDQSKKQFDLNLEVERFPQVTINHFEFQNLNELEIKDQHFLINKFTIRPSHNPEIGPILQLQGNAVFEQLLFKETEGSFLKNKHGGIDLKLKIDNWNNSIQVLNSSLKIKDDLFHLSGGFDFDKTNKLNLKIKTNGSYIKDLKPLLADKIQRILKTIFIDQPIEAEFQLKKLLDPNINGVVDLGFKVSDSNILYKDIDASNVSFVGHFANDCNQDGLGGPEDNCIVFSDLTGDLLGVIPISLNAVINELQSPEIDIQGSASMNMIKLNSLLSSKNKITFEDGRAEVVFDYQGELNNVLSSPFDEQHIKMNGKISFEDISIASKNSDLDFPSFSGAMEFDDQASTLTGMELDWLGSHINISGKMNNLPEFFLLENQPLRTDLSIEIDSINLNKFKKKSKMESTFKLKDFKRIKNIAGKVADNINGKISLNIGNLALDSFFLSHLSTEINLLSAKDSSSLFSLEQFHANFMGNTPINFDIDLSNEINKKLTIDLNVPSAAKPINYFTPKEYQILYGDVSLDLITKIPLLSLLNSKNILKNISFEGAVGMKQLEVELAMMDWPLKGLTGIINFDDSNIDFEDMSFKYRNSPFKLSGAIVDYSHLSNPEKSRAFVDLKLHGDYINLRTKKADRSKNKSTKKSDLFSPKKLFQSLDTIFQLTTAKVDLKVDQILLNDQILNPLVIQAQLVPGQDDQYLVKVDSFNFGLGPQNNIKGSATIMNPEQPEIDASFLARMKFSKLGELLPSSYVALQEGTFELDLDYKTLLLDTLSAINYLLNAEIDGKARIANGKIFYNYRNFRFEEIDGLIKFDSESLFIDALKMKLNDNHVFATGKSTNFFNLFVIPDQRAIVEIKVSSPNFDFANFTTPRANSLAANTSNSVKIPSSIPAIISEKQDTSSSNIEETLGLIDLLLDRGTLEMEADFDKVVYKKIKARDVSGLIGLQPDTVRLEDLKLKLAKGTFRLDGLISDIINHEPKLAIHLSIKDNDIKELFRQFEDFGTTNLTHDKLEGIVDAKLNFKTDIDSDYALIKNSMDGQLALTLSGAELNQMDFLTKKKGFIFKNRRLENLVMDTIEIFSKIHGNDIFIEDFLFHSSAFDFNARGVYSLDSASNTEIMIRVPFQNLTKRYLSKEEMASLNSVRKGPPIHLRGRFKKGKFKLNWKIFDFRRKEKEEKDRL